MTTPSVRLLRGLALPCALALAASCSGVPDPRYFEEDPVRSGAWVELPRAPAWIDAPPARDGWWRAVVQGASNLRAIAVHEDRPDVAGNRVLRQELQERLAPACGADASRVVDALLAAATMVRRACKEEVLSTRPVPGNTLCTAWALWEAPLDVAVATLPEESRDAARAVLASAPATVRR